MDIPPSEVGGAVANRSRAKKSIVTKSSLTGCVIPYFIPPMESLSEEHAAFAREQLASGCDRMEEALARLLDSKGRVAEDVHTIRKLGKTLRGGFTLFRLGKSSALEIQAISRLLSGPRDAVSRLKTWKRLAWKGDAPVAAAIAGLLDQQTHSAARRPPPETVAWCTARITAARKNLVELPAGNLQERLALGLAKLTKQVAKRCRKLDDCGEHEFHDARKALKAYLGALGFFPTGAIVLDPKMIELAELLGDENDLTTLANWLEEHGFTTAFVPGLWQRLADSRRKLRKKALRDATHVMSMVNG